MLMLDPGIEPGTASSQRRHQTTSTVVVIKKVSTYLNKICLSFDNNKQLIKTFLWVEGRCNNDLFITIYCTVFIIYWTMLHKNHRDETFRTNISFYYWIQFLLILYWSFYLLNYVVIISCTQFKFSLILFINYFYIKA